MTLPKFILTGAAALATIALFCVGVFTIDELREPPIPEPLFDHHVATPAYTPDPNSGTNPQSTA